MTPFRRPRGPAGRREGGFVLFLAIFVLLIVTVAGIATMLATSMDLTLSGNETKISKIFYAADSGIGYCAARLRTDVNYVGGTMPVGVSTNYGSSSATDIQVTLTRPLVIGWVHLATAALAGDNLWDPQIVGASYRLLLGQRDVHPGFKTIAPTSACIRRC
jgi:hypothetical protein